MHEDATAIIDGDKIVITLHAETLQHAIEGVDSLYEFDAEHEKFHYPIVTDPEVFLKEVAAELNREKEDGTTPIHELFDQMFINAVEAGTLGVVCPFEEEYEEAKRAAR
jgi:hypothetical protein